MKSKTNAIRKIIAMELPLLGILIQVAGYALIWFRYYYPLVRLRLKFYFNGHALVLVIYFILLLFFMATYGGFNAGYMKKADVILSQSFSLLAVNVISYLEDSLLRNWLLPAVPLLVLTAAQIAFAVVWVGFCDRAYKRAFPPLSLSLIHGSRDIKEIMRKFGAGRNLKGRQGRCSLGYPDIFPQRAHQVLLRERHPYLHDAEDPGCADQGIAPDAPVRYAALHDKGVRADVPPALLEAGH